MRIVTLARSAEGAHGRVAQRMELLPRFHTLHTLSIDCEPNIVSNNMWLNGALDPQRLNGASDDQWLKDEALIQASLSSASMQHLRVLRAQGDKLRLRVLLRNIHVLKGLEVVELRYLQCPPHLDLDAGIQGGSSFPTFADELLQLPALRHVYCAAPARDATGQHACPVVTRVEDLLQMQKLTSGVGSQFEELHWRIGILPTLLVDSRVSSIHVRAVRAVFVTRCTMSELHRMHTLFPDLVELSIGDLQPDSSVAPKPFAAPLCERLQSLEMYTRQGTPQIIRLCECLLARPPASLTKLHMGLIPNRDVIGPDEIMARTRVLEAMARLLEKLPKLVNLGVPLIPFYEDDDVAGRGGSVNLYDQPHVWKLWSDSLGRLTSLYFPPRLWLRCLRFSAPTQSPSADSTATSHSSSSHQPQQQIQHLLQFTPRLKHLHVPNNEVDHMFCKRIVDNCPEFESLHRYAAAGPVGSAHLIKRESIYDLRNIVFTTNPKRRNDHVDFSRRHDVEFSFLSPPESSGMMKATALALADLKPMSAEEMAAWSRPREPPPMKPVDLWVLLAREFKGRPPDADHLLSLPEHDHRAIASGSRPK